MILEKISFATFNEIEPGIMEIVAIEGLNLDGDHISRIETGLHEKYNTSFALLVNRINSYSHTHASMKKVAELGNLAALAIVVYSDFSKMVAMIHQRYQENVCIFEDKDEAVAWLREALRKNLKQVDRAEG